MLPRRQAGPGDARAWLPIALRAVGKPRRIRDRLPGKTQRYRQAEGRHRPDMPLPAAALEEGDDLVARWRSMFLTQPLEQLIILPNEVPSCSYLLKRDHSYEMACPAYAGQAFPAPMLPMILLRYLPHAPRNGAAKFPAAPPEVVGWKDSACGISENTDAEIATRLFSW